MTIILDLDDVLANLRESLYQAMHRATGIDRHWQDWPHYDLRQHFEVDDQFLDTVFQRDQVLEHCQPESGAAVMTEALAELGFEVRIVTARGWHPDAYAITQDWLLRHGMQYDVLHVTQLGGNKLEALDGLDNIVLAVDDHPSNLQRFQQAGIATLMPARPWNADYHDALRIDDLQAVVDYAQTLL